MAKQEKEKRSDLEECRDKINALLAEYNCEITTSCGGGCWPLLCDLDTDKTIDF